MLLREIITALKKQYERNPEVVAVTASTGLAACNVGGITLHSFAGFGLGKGDVPELVRTIKRNKKAFERWRRTKVLIIDESTTPPKKKSVRSIRRWLTVQFPWSMR